MSVFWPSKDDYYKNQESINEELFTSSDFATLNAPEWLNLLWTFYGTPASPTGGASVCSVSSDTSVTLDTNALMINPTVGNIDDTLNAHAISMEIARTVDTIYIQFGADFTPLLSSALFRHLQENAARRLRALPEQQVRSRLLRDPRLRKMRALQFTSPPTFQSTYPLTDCTDSTFWVDSKGDGCAWYQANDTPGCPTYGMSSGTDWGTAKDNCCFCMATTNTDTPTHQLTYPLTFQPTNPPGLLSTNPPFMSTYPTSIPFSSSNPPALSPTNPPGLLSTNPPFVSTYPTSISLSSSNPPAFSPTNPPFVSSANLNGEDFLYSYGGDILGTFGSATYDASWDRQFYMLTDGVKTTVGTYVSDLGEGLKQVPVVYFPYLTSVDLSVVGIIDDALAIGGQEGYLVFSASNPSAALTLYAFNPDASIAEVPKTSLGLVVPIVYCYGSIGGVEFDHIVGGYEESWYSWGDDTLTFEPVDASLYFALMDPPIEILTIDLTAIDEVRFATIILWMVSDSL